MVALDEAVIRKQTWKSPAMRDYAVALLTVALRRHRDARPWFNNDDVGEELQPLDKTTVGAVFRMLTAAGVIVQWRGNDESKSIYGGMRRSLRPENNGHRNQLYTLTSPAIAMEYLHRHGLPRPTPSLKQMTLF